MPLEPVFGVLLIISLYVLVYYRLMVRFYHAKSIGKPQNTFAALLSIPQYRNLDENGKRYARRWWYTLFFMAAIIVVLALRLDFGAEDRSANEPSSKIGAVTFGNPYILHYCSFSATYIYRARV